MGTPDTAVCTPTGRPTLCPDWAQKPLSLASQPDPVKLSHTNNFAWIPFHEKRLELAAGKGFSLRRRGPW
jgi:hypothetical protein